MTHLLQRPKSKTLTTPNAVRMWSNRNSHSLLVEMQNSAATLEDTLVVSYKTEHTLTIQSSNHASWYLPKGMRNYVHTKTCTQIFTAALFIIAKTWKQWRYASVGERINKPWHTQTTEYSSVLKRNELPSHEKTWRNLKCTLLSERSQSEKATYCIILITWHSGKGKIMETVERSVVDTGCRGRGDD